MLNNSMSYPVTGGLDRAVRFWNPYVTGKPIAVSRLQHRSYLYFVLWKFTKSGFPLQSVWT